MFDKEYRFTGRHAERIDALKNIFDKESGAGFFYTTISIYINAPIIGFLYGRTAEQDNSVKVTSGHIFASEMIRAKEELTFNLQIIMLFDKEYEPDEEKRINKAFRHIGEDAKDIERFNSYARGGIDVLYEKLISDDEIIPTEPDDYINNLCDFATDFKDRFNSKISTDDILNKYLNNI